MKKNYKAALALLAGITLGGAPIQVLHAQTKSAVPVYVVNEVDVTDQAGFKTYSERQEVLIKKNGGRYIIRGGKINAIDGTPPKRFTIYVFDNVEKMQSWQNDPAQKELMAMRSKIAKFRSFAVEGISN